jgi:hypothetical protein
MRSSVTVSVEKFHRFMCVASLYQASNSNPTFVGAIGADMAAPDNIPVMGFTTDPPSESKVTENVASVVSSIVVAEVGGIVVVGVSVVRIIVLGTSVVGTSVVEGATVAGSVETTVGVVVISAVVVVVCGAVVVVVMRVVVSPLQPHKIIASKKTNPGNVIFFKICFILFLPIFHTNYNFGNG